jgi:Zn-dependent protease
MVLSLTVHEWAHAWSAYKLGDDTAAMEGRLNLNPLSHIDPIGTILLPLLGIPFGWAKPVPVRPERFRRGIDMKTGFALTAAAGPLSNLVLAVLLSVIWALLVRFAPGFSGDRGVVELLRTLIQFNVGLFIFNLIPIPPLDGSRIVDRFVPYGMRNAWESFSRAAPLLLLVFIYFGSSWLYGPIAVVLGALNQLMHTVFSWMS